LVHKQIRILNVLANLSAKLRREILEKLLDLEAEGWRDAADLTDEERRLIESRLEAHRRNPDAAIPWADVEAELIARFGK
jgi:putative addiction module component (TIGR02574 family)